jgi:hypothetical protein
VDITFRESLNPLWRRNLPTYWEEMKIDYFYFE